MNRMDEYTALLAELEQTPEELDHTVNKALNRKNALRKKRRFFSTALGGLAACFAAFVLLVNLSTPFARACGRIPLLADLAKAVSWSPSLSAAGPIAKRHHGPGGVPDRRPEAGGRVLLRPV